MGNRAVISFKCEGVPKEYSPSIYLHWNGGRDSIEGFLKAHEKANFQGGDYGIARLVQLITNSFDGGLSVGVGVYCQMDTDNGDNGVYWVDPKTFEIVDREFKRHKEQQVYNIDEFANSVLKASNLPTYKTEDDKEGLSLGDIESAIFNGYTVHWKNKNYRVIKDKIGQYLIKCLSNNYCVGLTRSDGTLIEDPKDFYLA